MFIKRMLRILCLIFIFSLLTLFDISAAYAGSTARDEKKELDVPFYGFETISMWKKYNSTAGTVTGQLYSEQKTEGSYSDLVTFNFNPGNSGTFSYLWDLSPYADWTDFKAFTMDIYPFSQTEASYSFEPMKIKITDSVGILYEYYLPRLVANEWNKVRIDLPPDLPRNSIKRITFYSNPAYSSLNGRTQTSYLFDNMSLNSVQDEGIDVICGFESTGVWDKYNSSAGTVSDSVYSAAKTEGSKSTQITYALNSGVNGTIGYVWNTQLDMCAASALTLDIYPFSQTDANYTNEPLKIRVYSPTGILYENAVPLLTANKWNTVRIEFQKDIPMDDITKITIYSNPAYSSVGGRTQLSYLLDNMRICKIQKYIPLSNFDKQDAWAALNSAAGTMSYSAEGIRKTEGVYSAKAEYSMVPNTTGSVELYWDISPAIDLSKAEACIIDIYPMSQTVSSAGYEPLKVRFTSALGTVTEQRLPALSANQWNVVRLDLSALANELSSISRISFCIEGSDPNLQGRSQLTYYFDNLRSSYDIRFGDVMNFDTGAGWTGSSSSAGSSSGATETSIKDEGTGSRMVTYSITPGTSGYINYNWTSNPSAGLESIDLSKAKALVFDVYPTTQTDEAYTMEPLKLKILNSGNIIFEQALPRMKANEWNRIKITYFDQNPRDAINKITFYTNSGYGSLEGRTQLIYYIDNMHFLYDDAGIQEINAWFDCISEKRDVLDSLIQQCETAQKAVEYEKSSLSVMNSFITYGRDDAATGYLLPRAEYVALELEKMYVEATEKLLGYLNGSRTPLSVPVYTTQLPGINGYSYQSTVRYPESGQTEVRPVFFTGYLGFDYMKKDIGIFPEMGANVAGIEAGINTVVYLVPEWQIGGSSQYTMSVDKTVLKSGLKSLKLTNQSPLSTGYKSTTTQGTRIEGNTAYELKLWVKGQNVNGASIWINSTEYALPSGTYDWQQLSFVYTSGRDTIRASVKIIMKDVIDGLWLDDMMFNEVGNQENLLLNADFEAEAAGENGKEYVISTGTVVSEIQRFLQEGVDNNVSIVLLMSPHYFPEWALQKWPELSSKVGDMAHNIYHPKAKEILQAYLQAIIPMVKDYSSLQSILLTNEPTGYLTSDNTYVQSLWSSYLQNLYGTVQALNTMYGSSYSAFDEVPLMNYTSPNLTNKPYLYDMSTFTNKLFSEWHAWMADVIHQMAPNIPLHSKIYSSMQFEQKSILQGVSVEQFSQFSQISGLDNYDAYEGGAPSLTKKQMLYDFVGSMKQMPVVNSEDHITADKNGPYLPGNADYSWLDLWQGAFRGRSGSVIWLWQRYSDNKRDTLSTRPDMVKKIAEAGSDLNRLSREVAAFQNMQADVAILYSHPAHVYGLDGYMKNLLKAYTSLSYSGQKVAFITENKISSGLLSQYRLLFIPEASNVHSSTIQGIKGFLQAGGKVIISGTNPLSFDEYNRPHPSADRDYILYNSTVIPSIGSINAVELRNGVVNTALNQLGINGVLVKDAQSGETIYNVEWRTTIYNGKRLINISNLTETEKEVYIEVNGQRITEYNDLISTNSISSNSFRLKPLKAYLFDLGD